MIYELTIDKEENILTSTIDTLSKIDLSEDILIVCPYKKDFKYITFEDNCFGIYNDDVINSRGKLHSYFQFWPMIKFSTPKYIYPGFTSAIQGMQLLYHKHISRDGINLNQKLTLLDNVVNIDAIQGTYTCYDGTIVHLQNYDEDEYRKNPQLRSMQINNNTKILNLNFNYHAIGEKIKRQNNIYVVHYKLVFDSFPNLSG